MLFFILNIQDASFPLCSASVFGVSAESMQCSYDDRGNSVPTILMMMQKRLYAGGGLKVKSKRMFWINHFKYSKCLRFFQRWVMLIEGGRDIPD